jgi:hypothetical protein
MLLFRFLKIFAKKRVTKGTRAILVIWLPKISFTQRTYIHDFVPIFVFFVRNGFVAGFGVDFDTAAGFGAVFGNRLFTGLGSV